MSKKQTPATYEAPSTTALRVGRHRSYIRRLAKEGRIEGAIWMARPDGSGTWAIPSTWQAPILERGNPNFKNQSKSKGAKRNETRVRSKGAKSHEG